MKILAPLFLIFYTFSFQVLSQEKNSVQISLEGKYKDDVLLYFDDEFGNSNAITSGKNLAPRGTTITDSHWKHQINYYIPDSISQVSFKLENGYFVIDAGNAKLNKSLNFEVAYRQQIDPITDTV